MTSKYTRVGMNWARAQSPSVNCYTGICFSGDYSFWGYILAIPQLATGEKKKARQDTSFKADHSLFEIPSDAIFRSFPNQAALAGTALE